MAIKITQPTPSTLTIQLCGEHKEAMMDICGKVSGHSHVPDAGPFFEAKLTPGLSQNTSTNFRQIMGKLWDIKWVASHKEPESPF